MPSNVFCMLGISRMKSFQLCHFQEAKTLAMLPCVLFAKTIKLKSTLCRGSYNYISDFSITEELCDIIGFPHINSSFQVFMNAIRHQAVCHVKPFLYNFLHCKNHSRVPPSMFHASLWTQMRPTNSNCFIAGGFL